MPVTVTRSSTLSTDNDGDGIADTGEALTVRIRVTNATPSSVANLQVFDTQNGLNVSAASVKITPIAFDDTLPTITGNTPYTFNKSALLGNDVDPNDPSATFTIQLGAGVNGTIVDNGNGTLTFTPTTGFTGAASFTYTVTNTNQSESSVSTATVSLNVSGLVWYVDSGYAGANGAADGSYLKPFTSLASLNGTGNNGAATGDVDGAGDTIFVYDRGVSYTGGITLEASQKLFGDGHAFTVNGLTIGASANNSTITQSSGTVITLSTDNTLYGLTINTGGAGVTGLADGNGSVSSTTGSQGLVIDETSFTGTGRAIDIDQGGKLNVDIDSLSSGSSTSEGIQLAGTGSSGTGLLTGTFNATTGTIQTSTGVGFLIGAAGGATAGSGGDATITYGGQVNSAGGNLVEIQDRTGGTVTFTGSFTDGAGPGIVADGNAGTINFNNQIFLNSGASTAVALTNNSGVVNFNTTGNGLDITTTSGTGLLASGGGTLSITGAGNSITSSNATALNITNTTIGASGVTFRSISAGNNDAGADPVSGIILNNTGATAGLTVTGDGNASNNGSGGTIQHTSGDGVSLTNTAAVRLGYMNITDNLGDGIGGDNVNGFVLNRSNVTGNGDDAAFDESGVRITNLTGGAQGTTFETGITNSNIRDNEEFEVEINNSGSGTLTNFVFTNNTVSDAGGTGTIANLINFLNYGNGSMTLTTSGGTYNGAAPNTATAIMADNSGTGGLVTANINGGTFTNNNVAVSISSANQGNVAFTVSGITATGGRAQALNLFIAANSTGSVQGSFLNNVIGTAGVTGSASQVGYGIAVQNEGSTTTSNPLRIRIDGNTVQELAAFSAINVNSGIASQAYTRTMDVTITNNTIGDVDSGRGIVVSQNNATNTTGSAGIINADIRGNHFNGTIVGQAGDGTVLRLRELAGGSLNIVQLAPSAATNPNELDDANNLNGTTRISIGGSPNYGSAAPALPSQGMVAPIDTLVDARETWLGRPLLALATPIEAAGARHTWAEQPRFALERPIDGDESGQPYAAAPSERPAMVGALTPAGLLPGDEPSPLPNSPVVLNGDQPATQPNAVDRLSQGRLDTMVAAAIQRWADAGASAEQIAAMRAVRVTLTDMMGVQVGSATAGAIQIDDDGAGYGWFIDATPGEDGEFGGAGTRLSATADGGAAGHMDLLTVLMHELGHQIGLDDTYLSAAADDLMYGYIGVGERRLPAAGEAARADGTPPAHEDYLLSPVATVGTLPAGKIVDITFVGTVTGGTGPGLVASLVNTTTVTYDASGSATSAAEITPVDALTLGDRVFLDVNKNGVYDAGTDTPIVGVSLTLFADTNGNGVYDDGTDLAISYIDNNSNGVFDPAVDTPAAAGTPGAIALTVTTNASGIYSFDHLDDGNYIVRINASNFTGGGPLVNRRASLSTSDPDNNIDNDSNATQFLIGQAGTYAASQAITLDYNSEPTAGTGNDTNNTLDFGFIAPNQPPVQDLNGAAAGTSATLAYTENGAAAAIAPSATVTDSDSADFNGGSLRIAFTANGTAADQLTIRNQGTGAGQIGVSGSNVTYGGTTIGTFAGGANGTDLVITFTAAAAATSAAVQALEQNILYANNSENPSTAARTVTFTLIDGDGTDGGAGNDTGTATATINVTAVNDAPVITAGTGTASFVESGSGPSTPVVVASNITVADVDNNTLSSATASITGNFNASQDVLGFTNSNATTFGNIAASYNAGTGVLTLTSAGATATVAQFQAALQAVTYTNSSDAPTTGTRTVSFVANDSAANSAAVTRNVTITATNDAPTFNAVGTTTTLVSASAAGVVGNANSFPSVFSPDGTKVAFYGTASNLVGGDTNGVSDIFVKDLTTGAVTLVSTTAGGTQGNGASIDAVFSPDGTKVAFASTASNLVAGDTNGTYDIFVKDLVTGTVTLVSTSAGGTKGNNASIYPVFSPDGTKLAFYSSASNLVAGDTNGQQDIFVKDLVTGAVTLVSVTAGGTQGNGVSYDPVFSPDGTKVAFESDASNLVAGDTNGARDVFVKDLTTGAVTLVSASAGGTQGNGASAHAIFSPDGTTLAFYSSASNLVAGDTNGQQDIFVKNLATGVVTLVSTSAGGAQGNGASYNPVFSPDGTRLAFDSVASNLVAGDANGASDVFIKDLATGAVTLVSTNTGGTAGNGASFYPIFSPDGTVVAFQSAAGNLVGGDTNGASDVFVKQLGSPPATYVENGAAVTVTPAATVLDLDNANFNGGSFSAAVTAGAVAGDALSLSGTGITVAGGTVSYRGTAIGTLTASATSLSVALNGNATRAAVQALTQAVQFASSSEDPGAGARTVTFTLVDGGGVTGGGTDTASFTRIVNVMPVDDGPTAIADTGATTETTTTSGNVLTNDTDIDGGPKTVTAVNGVTASVGQQITLASGALLTVNADGTYTYNPNGKFNYLVSPATAAATGATNGQATDSFTYTVNGGSTATATVTVTGVDGPGDELRGNDGDNVITGTPQADLFNLSQGGADTVSGGDSSDGFYFGAALTAADTVDGQGGDLDQVGLQGNYAGLVLGANTIRNVEQIVLLSGTSTAFGAPGGQSFSYNITSNDGNIAAGQVLTISANTLVAGEISIFNAAAELDGAIIYYGGNGTDTVTGSQRNDGFFFAEGRFGAGDSVDGQGGNLDQLALQGNYTITFGATQMTSIENLVLISAHDVRFPSTADFTYNITMNNGNVAANASFAVTANTLAAGESLTLNATAETDAAITVYGGAGNDVLNLGQLGDTVFGDGGNDTINGNGGADRIFGGAGADQLSGGTGNDTFFYLAAGDSTAAAQDHILDFTLGDLIDVSTMGNFSLVTGSFTAAGQLRVTSAGGGNYLVEAETTGDGNADLSILVTSNHALTASDFVGVTASGPGAFHLPVTPVDLTADVHDWHGALNALPEISAPTHVA